MRPVSVLPVPADPADPLAALVSLSNQDVQDQVTTRAGRMAAGEAQLLLYVGELDARAAWADLDPTTEINAGTLPNTSYDKLNLHYAVEVLLQTAA
jgi:hypothetical protein